MGKNRVRHHVNPLADRKEHSFDGFENENPIIVDIGADRGEFSAKLLDKWGENKNLIVSEIRKPLANRLEKKFSENKNVIVFDGDMVRNIKNILKPSIDRGVLIEGIYVNFPDPWFKERHKKRRVVTGDFLKNILQWAQPETRWIFQTDQKNLFEETVEILGEFRDDITFDFFNEPPYGFTTKWEDAKTAAGSEIYRLQFYVNEK